MRTTYRILQAASIGLGAVLCVAFLIVTAKGANFATYLLAMCILFGGFWLYLTFGRLADKQPLAWDDARVGVGTVQRWHHRGYLGKMRAYDIEMDVEGEDGNKFEGTVNAGISRKDLQKLDWGQKFPVIYRASKPKKLRVPSEEYLVKAQLMYDYVMLREGLVDQATLDADYWGLTSEAEITAATRTGRTAGKKEEFEVALLVEPRYATSFPSTAYLFLLPSEQEKVFVSQRVKVKYKPDAPQRSIIKASKILK